MTNEIRSDSIYGISLFCVIPSALVITCLVFALVLEQSVYAAVFHIASGDVAGLINAITTANSNGQNNTIELDAGTYTLTSIDNNTNGPNGLPSISSKVTIEGAGDATTIIKRVLDGQQFRIFHVDVNGTLIINGLTISNGSAGPDPERGQVSIGGGIFNNGGILNLNNSTVSGNGANFGIAGGIWNEGTAMIINSRISDNFPEAGDCGGIANSGPMNITNSVIDGNHADLSAGGVCNSSEMMIGRSTISGNSVEGGGGGIANEGNLTITDSSIHDNFADFRDAGGIVNVGNLTITNSTIADNVTFFEGEENSGGITNFGLIKITNSTIANNTEPFGDGVGGIMNDIEGAVYLDNTILAHNATNVEVSPNPSDCNGEVTSLGNNIIGDTAGCNITLEITDLIGNPGLDAFANNGTPGNGHFPLLSNSQAINAGNNDICLSNPILHADQIGAPRIGICDIGSIEFEPFKNLGDCISTLIQQKCSGLRQQSRDACNHEQQAFCSSMFKGE